jgi:hypothetical protein
MSERRRFHVRISRFLLLPLLVLGTLAWSAETDCTTVTGAVVPDGQVSAQATFTPMDGSLTITLSNTLADPKSAGQLLSGLAFTVSEGETSGTLGGNSANVRKVNAGGTFMDFGPSGTGWALAQNFNGGLELCVLCRDLGSLGPSHLLIGAPATSGTYANANRSIAGNGPHNPFTAGTATFLVNVPGVTVNSAITSATFFFSTTEGVSAGGTCSTGGGSGPPQ